MDASGFVGVSAFRRGAGIGQISLNVPDFYKRPLIDTGMNKFHNAVWKNRYFVFVFLGNSL